ncbi:MAG: hypothetical protein BWZ10_03382 [candidate division BRC1 bacterium ADurb.BinA364]|nr:MAG: hypothetical protein BWZ10_03382 [candidate division BRC1 bacterium ADurb.BinA364]
MPGAERAKKSAGKSLEAFPCAFCEIAAFLPAAYQTGEPGEVCMPITWPLYMKRPSCQAPPKR